MKCDLLELQCVLDDSSELQAQAHDELPPVGLVLGVASRQPDRVRRGCRRRVPSPVQHHCEAMLAE